MCWFFSFWLLSPTSPWQFSEVTASAGIQFEHRYDYVPTRSDDRYFVAGGAAVGDYDSDGLPDLYLVGGSEGQSALYHNMGDGRFEDRAQQAGVALPGRFGSGPLFVDYDGDGWLDLFVGGVDDPPLLFRNRGDGTFSDVTAQAGLTSRVATYNAAFGDVDRDGDLDLFLTHWNNTHGENHLWINDGAGRFESRNLPFNLLGGSTDFSFSPNFADINNDGWPDLLLASDFGNSVVLINRGNGSLSLSEQPALSDENGMGTAVGDFDNDGDLDWFVSSIWDPNGIPEGVWGISGNRLYRNPGNGIFEDATEEAGVREGYWGWGSCFGDFNNDGFLDLFHVNGYLSQFATEYFEDPARFFLAVGDGSFVERSEDLGLDLKGQGRGVIPFDYDRDGDLDLLVANNLGPARLFRNDGGNRGRYLNISLRNTTPNTRAIGARIYVSAAGVTQMRELRVGNNYVSQNPTAAHFGMDQATHADIRLIWPDGLEQRFENLATNQTLTFEHPDQKLNCSPPGERWITHITRAGAGFRTLVFVKNLTDFKAGIDLIPYDAAGGMLTPVKLDLKPGETLQRFQEELFSGQAVSHFRIVGPRACKTSVGYRLAEGETATALINEDQTSATQFEIYPGNWDIVFDGMALVNLGQTPISVQARLVDPLGIEGEARNLSESLAPGAKLLALFDQLFDAPGSASIRVTTDGPARALFLRGTRPGIHPGLFFAVPAIIP